MVRQKEEEVITMAIMATDMGMGMDMDIIAKNLFNPIREGIKHSINYIFCPWRKQPKAMWCF